MCESAALRRYRCRRTDLERELRDTSRFFYGAGVMLFLGCVVYEAKTDSSALFVFWVFFAAAVAYWQYREKQMWRENERERARLSDDERSIANRACGCPQ